eukprot:GEZU01013537.1.p1 GENE.GEZU01013537.1~~GEZU01013537.1.p1  ORF type:complete len:114 (+),score=23.10 GEZU01013537.1:147-488(+)
MASSSSSFEPQNEQQILARFQQLRNEFNTYANKIAELELDQTDHRLVVGTLQKLEPERRCFRLVGGVLVERTVAEVLPAVQKNLEGVCSHLACLNLCEGRVCLTCSCPSFLNR